MLKRVARELLIVLSACLAFNTSYSQKQEDKFFFFDSKWKPLPFEKASILLRLRKTNDSSYNLLTYVMNGPRVSHETYIDEKATIRHGKCIYYRANGLRDSAGVFVRGVINGEWTYWNGDGKLIRKKTFENGALLSDSVYKEDSDMPPPKLEMVSVEVESSFPGGPDGWMRFLNMNFKYPQSAVNKGIHGTVEVLFIIDKDGAILEPEIVKSVEYSLDEELLRILQISPKWVPARIGGNPVKSYKRQPLTYRLSPH